MASKRRLRRFPHRGHQREQPMQRGSHRRGARPRGKHPDHGLRRRPCRDVPGRRGCRADVLRRGADDPHADGIVRLYESRLRYYETHERRLLLK